MHVSLNHRLLPADQARLSIWDGGFLYGDGIYTTLRLYRGLPLDLPAHWDRLSTQARALELPLPDDRDTIAADIAALVERDGFGERDGRVRITVSRGGGPDNPLPLFDLDSIEPTILITLVAIPAGLEQWQGEGIESITLDAQFSRGNVPELKTLNTLPALLAQRRAAAAGCGEAILTGPGGILLEGATSNVFLVEDGVIATPAIGAGFLAGLTRGKILDLAREEGIEVREEQLDRSRLDGADEVFVASSVREILPVVGIDGRPVASGRPGRVTRAVQRAYRKRISDLLKKTGAKD